MQTTTSADHTTKSMVPRLMPKESALFNKRHRMSHQKPNYLTKQQFVHLRPGSIIEHDLTGHRYFINQVQINATSEFEVSYADAQCVPGDEPVKLTFHNYWILISGGFTDPGEKVAA
jgi:hypothetical protein